MAAKRAADASERLREAARAMKDVTEGTSCSQTSFKAGGTAFLYVGEQGGRTKAMFKLEASLGEAQEMSDETPKDFQVGKNGWVTARFSDEKPMPVRLWKKWLKESYALAAGS
ncbi:MAG: MmcQ/YjbR family DNA-binding protein [Phycisphaerales bacterium JB043]